MDQRDVGVRVFRVRTASGSDRFITAPREKGHQISLVFIQSDSYLPVATARGSDTLLKEMT